MMQKETDKDKSSKAVTVRMPIWIYNMLKSLAFADRRSISNEILHLLESHDAISGWKIAGDINAIRDPLKISDK